MLTEPLFFSFIHLIFQRRVVDRGLGGVDSPARGRERNR